MAKARAGSGGKSKKGMDPPGAPEPPKPQKPVVDFVYRFDPSHPFPDHRGVVPGEDGRPRTAEEGIARLVAGNKVFADFMAACNREAAGQPHPEGVMGLQFIRHCDGLEVGLGDGRQDPFAAVLGCVDARVPIELALGQEFDDLMTIRTAGNTLNRAGEAMGSLHFALSNYAPKPARDSTHPRPGNIRLILVLGHTDCGAVKAAFEGFVMKSPPDFPSDVPPALFTILWEVFKAVKFVRHHRAEIGEDATTQKDAISFANAALTARKIDAILAHMVAKHLIEEGAVAVRFGLFDVKDHRLSGGELLPPPADDAALLAGLCAFVSRQKVLRGDA